MMKLRTYVLWAAALVALPMWAQDDMYFVPKKKAKVQRTKESQQRVAPATWEPTKKAEPLPTRDVDEYNRRYAPGYAAVPANDTLYLDDVETVISYEDSLGGGSESYADEVYAAEPYDFAYSRRLVRFGAPTVGIAVSSPLYWDLRYGPNSIYWDVYDDGFYAYAYPSVWNPYYDPFYHSHLSWSWHYGHWHAGWHHTWHPGYWHGWHRPPRPVAPGGGWTTTRPHTAHRQGVTFPPRGTARPATTPGSTANRRPTSTGRGQSSYSRPSQRPQRNTTAQPSRPNRGTTYTPSRPTRQNNSGSFNTGGGNRGGSTGGGGRSGGGRGRR